MLSCIICEQFSRLNLSRVELMLNWGQNDVVTHIRCKQTLEKVTKSSTGTFVYNADLITPVLTIKKILMVIPNDKQYDELISIGIATNKY